MFGIDTNITDMKCNIQMDHVLDISGYDFDQVHIALDILSPTYIEAYCPKN